MEEIRKARNGDVELAYVRIGPEDGMPLIMVNGAGGQIPMWPMSFCDELIERGFQVVLMDTRETGLSTHLTQYDVPRKQRPPLYTLRDLADDVIAVIDAVGWPATHLLGASQGGLIAQAVTTYHPDRVLSLTSALAGPAPLLRLMRPKLRPNLKVVLAMSKTSADREAEGRKWVKVFQAVGSPGYPIDEEHWREYGRQCFDRGLNPKGDLRLGAAVRRGGDRREALRDVRCPTLIVHGDSDPMCSYKAAKATAALIPGARIVIYPGMGHEFPRPLFPTIADEVAAVAARAGREAVA